MISGDYKPHIAKIHHGFHAELLRVFGKQTSLNRLRRWVLESLTKGESLRVWRYDPQRSCTVLTAPVPSSRLEWLDIARGIGITAVVLVHSMIPMVEFVVTLLSGFAIALFFIMAGLTYNGEKHRSNLRGFAISRGRQLLIPYFSLYTIMMLVFIPLSGVVDTYLTPSEVFFWFLYGAGPPNQATHLWFLPVLFFGLVLFAAIDSATHSISPRVRWPLVVLLPVLAFWITDVFSPMLVPWRVNSILLATSFCIVGYEIRRYRQLNSWCTESKVRDSAVFLILSVVLAVTSQLNGFVNFVMDSFGTNAWFYMITGTSGTIAVFMLSTIFEQLPSVSRAMRYLGAHSQVIYEMHPIFFYLVPASLVLLGWPLEDVGAAFNYFWPVRFVLALGFSIPFALVVSKNRILSLIFTGRRTR
ncbi:MAG: acyltransferase family protein [Candidatus Thorarchaeota archaeon SMTZ1-83]|nr:MAG: hypothetical protein AM324_02785 [Candidatus Thorarchaeota archaeon SMTZ1-83]